MAFSKIKLVVYFTNRTCLQISHQFTHATVNLEIIASYLCELYSNLAGFLFGFTNCKNKYKIVTVFKIYIKLVNYLIYCFHDLVWSLIIIYIPLFDITTIDLLCTTASNRNRYKSWRYCQSCYESHRRNVWW